MKQDLYNIAKCANGNVLLIGVDDSKIYDIIDKNERITICNSLSNCKRKSKKMYCDNSTTKNSKIIKVKKLRKVFKRKNIDFIICNISEIKPNMKSFLSNSVYINKNMLYIYGSIKDNDLEELVKKYKRYSKDVKAEIKDEEFIIYIDNKKTKTNFFKDKFYYIVDTISNIRNLIADILMG